MTIRLDGRLKVVPKDDGSQPSCDYPTTLMEILVAGNEALPNGEINSWNKRKSQELLMEYGDDPYISETENEYSPTARELRLKVARKLGVSHNQVAFAQMMAT